MYAPLILIAAASSLAACGGSSGGGQAGTTEADGVTVNPGHGSSSTSAAITNGDRSNAYDTTDDPSDPSFKPTPSPKLPAPNDGTGLGSSSDAISTTTGTTFQLTYYVVSLRPTGDLNQTTIKDCKGTVLTNASFAWRNDAVMQGTARYNVGGVSHTINAGSGCWVELPYAQRWGLGVNNPATGKAFELRPFRSIAVDPAVIKMGSWVYIKELDGVQMPYPASTMKHDGCVRAMDVGPAIKGNHIDFFSGYYSAYQKLIGGTSTMGGKESITIYSGTTKCATHIANGY
ncbi:MAG: 3D domain-containing protein [Polyangiales bacterium]